MEKRNPENVLVLTQIWVAMVARHMEAPEKNITIV